LEHRSEHLRHGTGRQSTPDARDVAEPLLCLPARRDERVIPDHLVRCRHDTAGSQPGQSEGIQRLLDDALLNPDTAALLLKEDNPANCPALARRAKGRLGNEASTLIDILDEQPDDDLKGTIIRDRNSR
jgi:hypothetical protein